MPTPRDLAHSVRSPWLPFLVGLAGAVLLAGDWEPVIRVFGAALVLAAGIALALGTRGTRELLIRIQSAIPIPEKGEGMIRELPKAWSELQAQILALKTSLQRENDLRLALLGNLKVGVVLVDPDRRLHLFNPAAQALLGSSSHLIVGGDLVSVFREPECLRNIEKAFLGQGMEWDLRRNPRIMRVRTVPFISGEWDQDMQRGVLLTLDDLTRQEALETTRQKFISNASHELKTPATSIRIAAENLQEGALVLPEGEPNLKSIFRAVDRMTMLLNDISELSRIETGALPLDPKEIEVGPFVQGLLEDVGPQAQAREVILRTEFEDGLTDHAFRADPFRLQQLLENLLSNAIKFGPPGGTVELKIWRDGPWLAWSVSDQGPGVASNDAGRIFERFYRAPSMRGVPGTGLGLSIVKHLSVLLGGEVGLESRPGRGATFTLRLPMAETKA